MNKDQLAGRLRALFMTELEEQVRALNGELLALEAEPQDSRLLGSVFRILHTLKGASHAAGVPEVENVCHALETLLAKAREGQLVLGAEEFTHLFAAADALTEAGERLKEGKDLGDSPLGTLQSLRFDSSRGALRESAVASPAGRERAPAVQAKPEEGLDRADNAQPDETVLRVAQATDSGADLVRVKAAKLDTLVASTGQLLVSAGRVAGRPAETERLHELVTRWRSEWRHTAQRFRRLARKEEIRAEVLTLVDDVERNLQRLADESGRLTTAGVSDSRALSHIVGEVEDRVRGLRLRPFADACAALPRAVRDLATTSGKEVQLEIVGGDVEADRAVIDSLQDVLLHLVRNAVDHGIEMPDVRERAGKSRIGTVRVAAALNRQRLEVTVADDGRGLDLAAIKTHLTRRGLEVPDEERGLVDALFQPGVSTLSQPTKISGRGVGLDAVRSTMERMRGTVHASWINGQGTSFALECPPSLATMRAVLVAIGTQTFAIPTARVERLLRLRPEDVRRAEGREVILTGQSPVPLISLARLLGPPLPDMRHSDRLPVVCLAIKDRRLALAVDELLSEEEVVVRPVERVQDPPAYLGGAALLPSGKVALVLNATHLLSAGLEAAAAGLHFGTSHSITASRRRILVVDDSITTRTLEQSILEAEGFDVLTATDGEEAWSLLQEHPIDLVVSDVEMPRMNGFDLCRAIRGSRRWSELPIILVTAQEAAEHRERGLAVGADAYLPKSSFDQQGLLDTIQQLLG